MGRVIPLVVIGIVAAVAVHSGTGSDGRTATGAHAGSAGSASVTRAGRMAAGGADLDALVKEAEARGIPARLIRSQADRAMTLARQQADRALARAAQDGTDPEHLAGLRDDAQKRLEDLRARIDSALSR